MSLNQGFQKPVGLPGRPDVPGIRQKGRALDALAVLGFAIKGNEALVHFLRFISRGVVIISLKVGITLQIGA